VSAEQSLPEQRWTVDNTWKVSAAALPFFFQFWFWLPLLPHTFPAHNILWLIVIALILPCFLTRTIVVEDDGIGLMGLRRQRIAWDNVALVRAVGRLGVLLPFFEIILTEPLRGITPESWRRRVRLATPPVPAAGFCASLRERLSDERLQPGLVTLAEAPVPSRRVLRTLLATHVALALSWLLVVLTGRPGAWTVAGGPPTTGVLLLAMLVIAAAVRQLLSGYLGWFEPRSGAREFREIFLTSSLQVLLPFLLGVRSDAAATCALYVYVWLVVVLEVFDLLSLLPYFVERRPRPAWAFALVAGVCFVPGGDLLWSLHHTESVSVAEWDVVGYDSGSTAVTSDCVVWPDGRVAVFRANADARHAELLLLDPDLRIRSRHSVPRQLFPSVHGEWVCWLGRDESANWTTYSRRFGDTGELQRFEGVQLAPAAGRVPSRTAAVFGLARSDDDTTTILRLDLTTGSTEELFATAAPIGVRQLSGDTLVWAERTERLCTLLHWSRQDGATPIGQVHVPDGASVSLSPFLEYLSFSVDGSGETRIRRVRGDDQWTLPTESGSKDTSLWSLPYYACRPGHDGSYRIFRLLDGGRTEEVCCSGALVSALAFSPDNRVLVLNLGTGFVRTQPVLVDMRTGRRRMLVLHQGCAQWPVRPYQGMWANGAFHYVTDVALMGRVELMRIQTNEL